jgi:pyruvate dehydrogenase (quinone)
MTRTRSHPALGAGLPLSLGRTNLAFGLGLLRHTGTFSTVRALAGRAGGRSDAPPWHIRCTRLVVPTTADLLVDSLVDWGVQVVFGIPGDGINGVIEALRKREKDVRFVRVRHEEAAALAACAYAKVTGRLGVCLATTGPGAVHLLNGLYDAKMDGAPVLAITGLPYHDLIGTFTQQDVATDRLFSDVAVYNERVMGPAHVENVVDLACRTAMAYRGVAHVTLPIDIQLMDAKERKHSKRNIPHHAGATSLEGAAVPSPSALRSAAAILNEGKKVAILAGQGALGASVELEEVAEILGAPVVKALLGKAVLPDSSVYTTGTAGLLGTKPSQEVLESCDTLLIVGSSFPYIEFMPKPDRAKAVQIDRDAKRIGLRYPAEIGLVGDARATLRALIPHLSRHEDRRFLDTAQDGMKEWFELMRADATRMTTPMKPQVPADALGELIRDDAIVCADSGTVTTYWARHVPAKLGQIHTVSGTLATMACALPYAIGAQVAYPERQVVAIAGDGGFSMLMAEFATCVQLGLPVKVLVLSNRTLGMIKWEQMVFLGSPEYGCELSPIDFAAFARACGGTGFTIEDPRDAHAILETALATAGPVIIDAIVDPIEPPLPPKVTREQGLKLAKALAAGEPDRGKIVKDIITEHARELI